MALAICPKCKEYYYFQHFDEELNYICPKCSEPLKEEPVPQRRNPYDD